MTRTRTRAPQEVRYAKKTSLHTRLRGGSGHNIRRLIPRPSTGAWSDEIAAASRTANTGLISILGYLSFTLLLYAYGPATFTRHAVAETIALALTYMAMFTLGYLSVSKKADVAWTANRRPATELQTIKAIILVGTVVALVKLSVYTSIETWSIAHVLDGLEASLRDPGTTYFNSLEGDHASGPIIWLIVLLSPISWSAFAVSVAYFGRLNLKFRILIIVLFLAECLRWVLEGRNKGPFDLVIIVAVIVWVRVCQGRIKKEKAATRSHLSGVFVTACVLGAIALFTRAIASRTDNFRAVHVTNSGPLLDWIPSWLQPTFIALTMYLGQGYHALSYVPQVEWTPTFGVGHSLFLSLRLDAYFGFDIVLQTYQAKLSVFGIDPNVNWHSLYVWLANDVHWLGVIPLMFVLGRFCARALLRAVFNDSASDYAMVALVGISLAYLPANAQVFQEPTTFVAFWGLLIYQAVSDRRSLVPGRTDGRQSRWQGARVGCNRSRGSARTAPPRRWHKL